jgi:hypothetical protein
MKMKPILVVIATVALAVPLAAQMFGPRMPTLSGIWHPEVGSGAAYERIAGGSVKSQMEITIVGKEDVGGKTGYWMEMAFADQSKGGQMVMKTLMTVADDGISTVKSVMQMPGQPPMEMDMASSPAARAQTKSNFDNIQQKAELVGTESITVPAGTFTCQHYHMKDGSGDGWISDKVSPWSLVKSQDKDSTMVLTKVITDAKDRITGTPTKFDPMQIMRNRAGQQ